VVDFDKGTLSSVRVGINVRFGENPAVVRRDMDDGVASLRQGFRDEKEGGRDIEVSSCCSSVGRTGSSTSLASGGHVTPEVRRVLKALFSFIATSEGESARVVAFISG